MNCQIAEMGLQGGSHVPSLKKNNQKKDPLVEYKAYIYIYIIMKTINKTMLDPEQLIQNM